MSLTKFIELPDVKAKFRQEFDKPIFSVKKQMLAPVLTSNAPMIGTAFDYLMRFLAGFLNKNAVSGPWVAEKALEILKVIKDDAKVIFSPKSQLMKMSNIDESPEHYIERWKNIKYHIYSQAKITIKSARKNLKSYLKNGNMSDNLIASALSLAKLDDLVTAGYVGSLKQTDTKNDMDDLRKLISIVNPETFKAEHTCVLNPNFGPEAAKLLSAAGDLVINDTLIDIKTYKPLEVKRDIFNQLMGYYTLYRIGGINGMSPGNKINKVGFYFSRHGYLHTYQIKDLVKESTFPDFIEGFKKRALINKIKFKLESFHN